MPDKIRSKVDTYKGFIIRHKLVGGRITTHVVEPEGLLLGDTNWIAMAIPTGNTLPTALWRGFFRDIFAPKVPIPDDFEPRSPGPDDGKPIPSVYPGLIQDFGAPWVGGRYKFGAGQGIEGRGIGIAGAVSDDPASDLYPGSNNHTTTKDSVQIEAYFRWLAAPRGRISGESSIQVNIFENGLPGIMPGYRFAPRMYPVGTGGSGSGLGLEVCLMRQNPIPSAARNCGMMVGAVSVSTSPIRTTFDYASGRGGILMPFVVQADLDAQNPDILFAPLTANLIVGPQSQVEPWDASKPWKQEFSSSVGGVTCDSKILYPPGGQYLEASITMQADMPNRMGGPLIAMMDDRVDVYVDYRMARTWIDERDGGFPGARPVSVQMQTGIVRFSYPYSIDYEAKTYSLGSFSRQAIVSDVSGAVDNCFDELGGDREDFHRLYRVRWAGNVGGRSVVIASMIKHLRWEREPSVGPGVPPSFSMMRATACSSISGDNSIVWQYTYYPPGEDPVNGWNSTNTHQGVRLPGDPTFPGNWRDSVGAVMYVDGVATEWDSMATGWSLIRAPEELRCRLDDWLWESSTSKFGTVVSDTDMVLCAYSFPPETNEWGEPTNLVCKLLRINVITGSVTELRQDPIPSGSAIPAITCYQREYSAGEETLGPCLIYSLCRFGSDGGWVEMSKDGGDTWDRIMEGQYLPDLGTYYIGSAIWGPEYGNIFNDY